MSEESRYFNTRGWGKLEIFVSTTVQKKGCHCSCSGFMEISTVTVILTFRVKVNPREGGVM